jgi:nucleotide-binding universal stress UspA family protein
MVSTDMTSIQPGGTTSIPGLVLLAYDGSELAGYAIEQAAQQLTPQREALVLCVWQPVDVGFVPTSNRHFDADQVTEVRHAAEETAAHGAALAATVGFRAHSMTIEAAPIWKGIVDVAIERQATLVVVGSYPRKGIVGHLRGSVASDVVAHAPGSVLVVHQRL